MTSKTSSTNDTCDGFKTVYSSIVSARSKPDQQNIPLSYIRSPNQHNVGKYQFFVRQNAFQSSPLNLRKEIAHSIVCDDIQLMAKELPKAEQHSITKSTDAEMSVLLSDSKSDSIIIGHSASYEANSMSCELADSSLTKECTTASRTEECSSRIYPKNQRFSHGRRG